MFECGVFYFLLEGNLMHITGMQNVFLNTNFGIYLYPSSHSFHSFQVFFVKPNSRISFWIFSRIFNSDRFQRLFRDFSLEKIGQNIPLFPSFFQVFF